MARERIKVQIPNVERFKSKMEEFVKDDSNKSLIFTEDLKNFTHIASPTDIPLLISMIKKFCMQSKEVRFGNFVFGPVVMRLFHHLKDEDNALKLFKEESDQGFFDQLISYQLLLDMLYEKGRYQDILDTFEIIKSRQVQGGRYPKHVMVLTYAACYKLNTSESFKYAATLFKESTSSGHLPMRKGVTFLSMLALNRNEPHVAIEVLTNVKQQNYMTVRILKALAYTHLQRFDDVLSILRSVLEIENPMVNKSTFPADVIETIKKTLVENSNKDLQVDFEKVLGILNKQGHISEESLDQILCREIVTTAQVPGSMQQQNRFQRYDNRTRDDNNRRTFQRREPGEYVRRPGLHELN